MTDPTAALAEALHYVLLECRRDYRGDRDCDGDRRHLLAAEEIIRRLPPDWCGHEAEITELNARLADEGYADAIRLAEAVNEVVVHQRGNIEEAWQYGDRERARAIEAKADLARLRAIEAAAREVVEQAAPDDALFDDGNIFNDCLVPAEAVDALRAALEATDD
ncbi:MAG TPA: hypothetical protein VLM76_13490 [Patescibacteria group bacterium]|nr:hypothetical protein [Patescibacteria group bacterium]